LRLWSAQAFTVKPGAVEAANAALPASEYRAGIVDPARELLWLIPDARIEREIEKREE